MKKILELEHAPGRSDGITKTILSTSDDIQIVNVELYRGEEIPDHGSFDAVIIGGGPMGVYEKNKPEYEFIKTEIEFLSNIIETKIPVLGICFGHQLLADIMGGEIKYDQTHAEFGWTSVIIDSDGLSSSLFKNIATPCTLFEYHKDLVYKKPMSATSLAHSQNCDQAFKYEDYPIWSTQFHPEIDIPKGLEIISSTRDKLEKCHYNVDEILESSRKYQGVGKLILQNFIQNIYEQTT